VTKIKDTGKTARKINPHELVKRLGAKVIEGTPKTGGGVPGMLAGAHFFAQRQRELRAAKKMGAPVGNHVRLWIRGKEMSIAGKVSGYLEEIERARGYSWREWSDEQMDDPMVLHVAKERNGRIIDWNKTRGEKECWIKRMVSPEWWEQDWSGGSLCWGGEFGPGVKMYRQPHAFAEGISSLVTGGTMVPYKPGCCSFILAVGSMESAEKIIRRVVGVVGNE